MSITCPGCGTENESDSEACALCSTPLRSSAQGMQAAAPFTLGPTGLPPDVDAAPPGRVPRPPAQSTTGAPAAQPTAAQAPGPAATPPTETSAAGIAPPVGAPTPPPPVAPRAQGREAPPPRQRTRETAVESPLEGGEAPGGVPPEVAAGEPGAWTTQQQPYGWARPWASPYYPVPPYFQPPYPFFGFPSPWVPPCGYPYAPQYPPAPMPYPPPQYPGGYPGAPYAWSGQGRKMRTRNLVLVIVAAILVIGGGVAAAVLLTGESKSSFKLGNGTALGAKIDFKNMVIKQYGSTLTLTGSYDNKAKKEGNAYITVQAIKKGSEDEVSFTVPIVKGSSKSFTAKKTVSYKLSGATLGSILFKGEEGSEEDGTNPPEDGNVKGQASFKLGNGTTPDGTIKIRDIELQQSDSKLTLTGYYDNVSNKVGNAYVTVKAAKDGSEEEIKFTFALVKGISNMFTEKKTVSYKLGGATLGSIGFEGEGGTNPPEDGSQTSPGESSTPSSGSLPKDYFPTSPTSPDSENPESTPDSESTSPTQ